MIIVMVDFNFLLQLLFLAVFRRSFTDILAPQLVISHVVIAAIVVSVLILVSAAIGTGVYFWYKHKKLYSQYTQLRNTHLPMDITLTEDVALEQ